MYDGICEAAMGGEGGSTPEDMEAPSGICSPRLVVIASEGLNTEKVYFEDMASANYYRNPKVHVEILQRENTASSPRHILVVLDDFKRKYRLNYDDQLWLVIDRDRWSNKELSSVASECQQKGHLLALSNPSKFLPFVETVIYRARSIDIDPTSRWPNTLGTRVYLLAESILNP